MWSFCTLPNTVLGSQHAYMNNVGLMVQNSNKIRWKNRITAVTKTYSTNISPTLCWTLRIQ